MGLTWSMHTFDNNGRPCLGFGGSNRVICRVSGCGARYECCVRGGAGCTCWGDGMRGAGCVCDGGVRGVMCASGDGGDRSAVWRGGGGGL